MTLSAIISKHYPATDYEALYKHFHANPELSFCEHETADTIAAKLSAIFSDSSDFTIATGIGGTGIAAVLKNGTGRIVALRADTDALPVREQTGLPYASTKRMKDFEGNEQPVMHACGHDYHMTSLIATAELLYSARDAWSGTLVLIFQPAEEKGKGAQAMVDDGLYTKHKTPIPDVVLGAHVMPSRTGSIGMRKGIMASSADSYRVTFHGHGGHASQPHLGMDPVMMAAYAATRLNGIIAREIEASQMATLTVPVIKAGEAENVIPDTAEMKLDIRAYDDGVRKQLNEGMKRVVKAEAIAAGAAQEPTIDTIRTFPITFNDHATTEKLEAAFEEHFGNNYDSGPQLQGSEDFPILATSVNRPSCFFVYGGTEAALYDSKEKDGKLKELPINHSAKFAPVIQPTLKTAIEGLSVAALTWLANSD
ncbi:hypothetical protein FH972_022985 [Carpinus fangiana]|uniref:Peptidase M20 dimerisation domain-containing protein n=1 Tax=Carpinus fangiana TaxID=176857 RepID=A0A5N6KU59_9ROSI|nr:hypothetical protein FH972_022985 [Carpinus fangiana]